MDYLSFAEKLAQQAGEIMLKHYHQKLKIETKDTPKDLVTIVDKKIEKLLIRKIKKTFPTHDVIGEESVQKKASIAKKSKDQYCWIIDPLDGTTNYIHHLPIFGISIALEYEEKLQVGVVFNPIFNELFMAEKGKGAFLNRKKIQVSKTAKISESLLATGFHPKYHHHNFKYFEKFSKTAQAVRRCGAAAIDLCYVACGRFDGFWEFGLSSWDVAAGSLIIEEAGGKVTNTDGTALSYEKRAILGTNGKIHEAMQKIIAKKIDKRIDKR